MTLSLPANFTFFIKLGKRKKKKKEKKRVKGGRDNGDMFLMVMLRWYKAPRLQNRMIY